MGAAEIAPFFIAFTPQSMAMLRAGWALPVASSLCVGSTLSYTIPRLFASITAFGDVEKGIAAKIEKNLKGATRCDKGDMERNFAWPWVPCNTLACAMCLVSRTLLDEHGQAWLLLLGHSHTLIAASCPQTC